MKYLFSMVLIIFFYLIYIVKFNFLIEKKKTIMTVNTHNLLPIMKLFYNFKNYMNSKPIMRRKSIHVKDIVMQKIRKINKNKTWRCGARVNLENNALQGSNYDNVILLLVLIIEVIPRILSNSSHSVISISRIN